MVSLEVKARNILENRFELRAVCLGRRAKAYDPAMFEAALQCPSWVQVRFARSGLHADAVRIPARHRGARLVVGAAGSA